MEQETAFKLERLPESDISRADPFARVWRGLALALGSVVGLAFALFAFVQGIGWDCGPRAWMPLSDAWICEEGEEYRRWFQILPSVLGPVAVFGGALATFLNGRLRWLVIGFVVGGVCAYLLYNMTRDLVPVLT